jgi:thioredoxin-dependent peroxiredoxin
VLGASFDTPTDNKAFKEAQSFAYPLLSDSDRAVGTQYQVLRASDHPFANFPERFSYLIDPSGVIQRAYDVKDPAGHAADVLADLAELQG